MSDRVWKYACSECRWTGEFKKKRRYFVSYQCPFCGDGFILDKTEDIECPFDVAVKQEPKTIGHLAARNTDEVGRAKVEDKKFKYKERRRAAAKKTAEATGGKLIERDETAKPWWRDGSIPGVKKFDKATDIPKFKNPKKYIETGED